MVAAFQTNAFQNDTFQVEGGAAGLPTGQSAGLFDHPPPLLLSSSQFVPSQNVLPQIYAQIPTGAQLEESHLPVPRPGQPERWKSFFDLSQLYAQSPIGTTSIDYAHPIVRTGTPEEWRNVLNNVLPQIYAQTPVGATSIDYAHPVVRTGTPEEWWNVLSNVLPEIYAQAPVGATKIDDAHPVVRPGTPERWKGFFDLPQIYAQTPIGVASVEVHPPAPKGNPESWRSFFDLAYLYSQQPVGARQDADGPPIYVKGSEPLPLNLLTTTLGVTVAVTLPFVYYDFSAHPSPLPPSQFVPNPNALPQIYAQSPVGARWEDDAHPIVRPGTPEKWRYFFDLSQVYAQQPIGAASVEVHPLAPKGNPEPWETIFDNQLPQIYTQSPIGSRWEDDAHPVVRAGTPELWETILSNQIPAIYSQGPVSRYLPDEERPLPSTQPVSILQNILLTTLAIVQVPLPFVYYDFSLHPQPIPPSQFVPNINTLPQIYAQTPIGAQLEEGHLPIPRPGVPEQWKAFFDLSVVYAQSPAGSRWEDDAHPIVRPGTPFDVYQNILLTTLNFVIAPLPFVYYDFSAHPAQQPPSQFVPNINTLPQIYTQLPVGAFLNELHSSFPPTIRGNPELWETILNNQLPYIYGFKPAATWFDFGVHKAYSPPSENVLFPNLALPFGPQPTKIIYEWLIRARRRNKR